MRGSTCGEVWPTPLAVLVVEPSVPEWRGDDVCWVATEILRELILTAMYLQQERATSGQNGRHGHPLWVEVSIVRQVDVRPQHQCGLIPILLALLDADVDVVAGGVTAKLATRWRDPENSEDEPTSLLVFPRTHFHGILAGGRWGKAVARVCRSFGR